MIYGNCTDCFPFPLDLPLPIVGDDEKVVTAQFFGGFNEDVELAFAGFLRAHVVAHLD